MPGQRTIGNFWVDLIRTSLRILLPIAFVFAIILVACGVIQNNNGFTQVHTVAGATQQIPGGPSGQHGLDQATRHQRRRLLQHQLGAPVLEPYQAQ